MKVALVTLARAGSKRIKNKNIIDINGKPLIQYTIDEVKKSKYYTGDNYIVSTDSAPIHLLCEKQNIQYDDRPTELCEDTTSSAKVIEYLINKYFKEFDYIIEIMVTNPMKTVDDIDAVIDKLVEGGYDSVCSVIRLWDYHPARVKYIKNGTLQDFIPEPLESRRQDLEPAAYIRNGSIYGMNINWFKLYKTRYKPNVTAPYIMPIERSINIDEPNDIEIAELLIKKQKDNYKTKYDEIIQDGFVV